MLIALDYLTILLTLVWFIRKRRDLPFSWIFVCFGVFFVRHRLQRGYRLSSEGAAAGQGLPMLQQPYSRRNLARKIRDTLDQRCPLAQAESFQLPHPTAIHHD
jgi:hypothetical protein